VLNPQQIYQSKLISIEEAAKKVKTNDSVFLGPGCSAPKQVVEALCARYQELENVDVHSALVMYPFEYFKPEYKGHFKPHTCFMGGYERLFYRKGNLVNASIQISQMGEFAKNTAACNIALIEVSPPDKFGNMFLGPFGVLLGNELLESADTIVVQVNDQMPIVYGERHYVNVNNVDYICEGNHSIPEMPNAETTEIDEKIASYIVPMVPDGATIQVGIGGTANAVAYGLDGKKDLGIHTELLTDSLVYLAKKGVVTNSKKNVDKGKIVCCFAAGNQDMLTFLDKNPNISIRPAADTNPPFIIAKNDNLISINSTLACDLTGQVGSEALGFRQFSGTGGQLDFVLGANYSKGGKSFITLPSIAKARDGTVTSRITLALADGTPITTPRSCVQYIVTEYGVADLKNKYLPDRVRAMIAIAHPDFREALTQQAKDAKLI
jgi:4-hydroxybutyrate CoA-transferase